MIYLDNAATTADKPDCVIQAVVQALKQMGNAGRGAHESALDAARLIYNTRSLLAELFGARHAAQVAFTANSTESLNVAIQGLFHSGDHVITTAMEHNSVLRPLYLMAGKGVELTVLPVDQKGNISYSQMRAAVQPNTRAVICTHASNLTGNLIDIKCVGEICQQHQLLFILDASQSAGVFEIDMQDMKIDLVCFTGHKSLMGPQGIGGLCVREGVSVRPLKVGGSGIHSYSQEHPHQMPEALEAGTLNGHAIAGLHAALEYLKTIGIAQIREKEQRLMKVFYDQVSQLPNIKIYGDFSSLQRAPIVTLNVGDYDSAEIADRLQNEYDIRVRAGAHCAPLLHQALGTVQQGAVRFSFAYHNSLSEIEAAVRALAELAAL